MNLKNKRNKNNLYYILLYFILPFGDYDFLLIILIPSFVHVLNFTDFMIKLTIPYLKDLPAGKLHFIDGLSQH